MDGIATLAKTRRRSQRGTGRMKQARAVKEFFSHPIIQTALVAGASTVILAYFSKRVLDVPLRKWELGLPALLLALFQGLAAYRKSSRFSHAWIGMLVIALSTVIVIIINL